jgi:hypothetical protein
VADRNKTLVLAMIEPCNRPIIFELTHTVDLSHWSGDSRDAAWQSYIADVRRIVEKDGPASAQAPVPPGISAAKPERGGEPGVAMLPIASRSGLPEDDAFAEDLMPEIRGRVVPARITSLWIPDKDRAGVANGVLRSLWTATELMT